jgi:hypothetical protein
MKIEVWCDSGANSQSCRRIVVDTEDLFDDWDSLTEEDQYEILKDIAWERLDWGFKELD